MVKSQSEKNRDTEARKRARGLHEYRVWAKGKDGKRDPEIGAALNEYAAELTESRVREVAREECGKVEKEEGDDTA